MKLNKKASIIASSVAAIALSSSLIAGSTFALFTSNSSVNVAVTSANVEVSASVSGLETYSKNVKQENGTFENGGWASVNQNELTLNNLSPMDSVEFDIDVVNNSTINVQYRTVLSYEGDRGLFKALDFTIDGEKYAGNTIYSNWALLEVGNNPSGTIHVSVSLPEDAGAEVMNKTCTITYKIEAVQGNATVENPEFGENDIAIYTANDLLTVAENVNEGVTNYSGKTLVLMNDIDMSGIEWVAIGESVTSYPTKCFCGTFEGNNYTISNITSAPSRAQNTDEWAADGLFGSLTGKVKNLTVENIYISGTHYVGGIAGFSSTNVGMRIENCHVKNATLISSPVIIGTEYNNGDKIGGIIGYTVVGDTVTNCTVENASITGYRHLGGIAGYSTTTLTDCSAKNITLIQNFENGYKNDVSNLYGDIAFFADGGKAENCTATDVSYKFIATKTEEAQSVLNNAKDNVTLVLKAGEYGALALNQFKAVSEVDGNYYKRTVNNLTIIGEDDATVDGFTVRVGHINGSGVNPITGETIVDTRNSYHSLFDITNLRIEHLNLTKAVYIAADQSEMLNLDGLTIYDCHMTGTLTGDAKVDNNHYNKLMTFASSLNLQKNIVVENCTVRNAFQGVYAYGNRDITIKNCEFYNLAHNAVGIQGTTYNNTVYNGGTVIIEGNYVDNTDNMLDKEGNVYRDRAIRIGDFKDGSIVIKNNTFVNSFDVDGDVIKASSAPEGAIVLENNTSNGNTLVLEGLVAKN